MHGDMADYPLVPVSIQFRGKMHRMEVAVNSHLKHPLILGTDWPAFTQLLGIVCADASWQTGRGQEEAAARTGEALAGPSPPASEETRASEGVKPPELDDFPLEQSRDETLKNAYDRDRSIDGQLLRPDAPLSFPLFFPYKREVVSGNPRCPVKGDDSPEPSGNAFSGGALFSHGRPLGGGKNTRTPDFFGRAFTRTATAKAPLRPLPLMEVPFERIGMDLIGPLERSARGYRFALVLVDYATRYPEAVPLRSISAKSVAEALFRIISRVGIPKEILTDQGTAFMSRTLTDLYGLLGIKSIRTSVYHPQTDGLVERFNRTLKTMVRKFVKEDAKNWDRWLEPLLFAVREVPQASTGFSPFELLYGRQPRGVLDVIKESWEEGPSNSRSEILYILDLRAKLHMLGRLSMENLLQAQDRQTRLYNRGMRLRQFSPGDKVLVLLPV